MILSDVSIRAAVELGRIAIDPFDPAMVQPSSIDVRIDRYYRVFQNHRYAFIDLLETIAENKSDIVLMDMTIPKINKQHSTNST